MAWSYQFLITSTPALNLQVGGALAIFPTPTGRSWGPNGDLYVTASQIENMPRFNNGKSTRTEPYKLWKITGLEKSDQSQ